MLLSRLRSGLVGFARKSAFHALVPALVVFLAAAGKSFAATDWTAIQAAMKTSGTVLPGDVLRFELVRRDTTYSVNGVPVPPLVVAAYTNGFVAFKQVDPDTDKTPDSDDKADSFYADGSLPAQASELSALQDALLKYPRIHITATYDHANNISPALVWLHFEATGKGSDLATSIAAALETIHNPQLGVTVVPGTNSVFDPSKILPPPALKLFDEGWVEQLNDTFAFYLPRPDEHSLRLHGNVPAEIGLGVAQSFHILVDFSGGSNVTLNIDFALRADELNAVQSMLRAGGFTLSSLGNNYEDDSHRLYFLHATASGDGFTLGATLYNVIQVIK